MMAVVHGFSSSGGLARDDATLPRQESIAMRMESSFCNHTNVVYCYQIELIVWKYFVSLTTNLEDGLSTEVPSQVGDALEDPVEPDRGAPTKGGMRMTHSRFKYAT